MHAYQQITMWHRKTLKFFILFSLFVLLLPTLVVEANAQTKPVLGISTVYEDRRTTVNLNVFIDSDVEIASGSFDVEYDQAALSNVKAEVGSLLKLNNDLTSVHTDTPGKISLAWAGASGKTLDGTLLTFSARISEAGLDVPLFFNNVRLYGEDGSEIDAQLVSGAVKPFTGKTVAHGDSVENDKVWTIRLNIPFNTATLNTNAVKVTTRSNRIVDVDVKQKDAFSFTVTPRTNYSPGAHVLEISEQLWSESGSQLKEPIRFEFRVQ